VDGDPPHGRRLLGARGGRRRRRGGPRAGAAECPPARRPRAPAARAAASVHPGGALPAHTEPALRGTAARPRRNGPGSPVVDPRRRHGSGRRRCAPVGCPCRGASATNALRRRLRGVSAPGAALATAPQCPSGRHAVSGSFGRRERRRRHRSRRPPGSEVTASTPRSTARSAAIPHPRRCGRPEPRHPAVRNGGARSVPPPGSAESWRRLALARRRAWRVRGDVVAPPFKGEPCGEPCRRGIGHRTRSAEVPDEDRARRRRECRP